MQKRFDQLRVDLERFLAQRDHGVLVLATQAEQIAYVLKTITGIQDSGSPHIFLLFAHPFDRAQGFADLVVERVQASFTTALSELGIDAPPEGVAPFPAICHDPRQPPGLRIREALTFARNLIPRDSGRLLVCAFFPLTVGDVAGWRELAQALIHNDSFVPWFREMRLMIRDELEKPLLPIEVKRARFVMPMEVDLSREALDRALEEEAADEALPKDRRAQALLQLAAIDFAWGRFPEAREKYLELIAYFQETGDATRLAMALNGLGETELRAKRPSEAQAWLERALVPASECGVPIVLFIVARNLAHLYFDQRQFAQAETFFDGAAQLGLLTGDPEAKILALEWRGLSQVELDAYPKAASSFEEAAVLAREHNREDHLKRLAGRLERYLGYLQPPERRAQVRQALGLR